ncbi:SUPPRESSOR OF GAMMA RESPONSE 1-like [Rhododendron vialii]|uniref:SUPPRESSOR OF GAMMA RESPONSE 1-like n=1 Tax=Rhododendron vialii TaxID=182163 RepID=UPI00265FC058|nr:SUPPRESSOR OF GAMMA RESPONSE 1-like [Rhododendron vialii]
MKRSWLIDYKGFATKVKNAGLSPAYQTKDCGAHRDCPKCHYRLDNTDVSQEWPGLPAGVKFDPSDIELLDHLAAKCRLGCSEPHKFIEEFIPTVDQEEGICYTHPENLPGVKKDGSSVHFFHRTINAYATGQRKRRKIHNGYSLTKEEVRWHKTGKTKPVMDRNGVQKGCKKIMVLYTTSKKGCKSYKSNWVMHQYHLGMDEDEIEERFVVSKIFYQPQKQTDNNESFHVIEESEVGTIHTGPRTPQTNTPDPPRPGKSIWRCDLPLQEAEVVKETSRPSSCDPPFKNETETYWLAGEPQAIDGNGMDHDSLLYNKILDSDVALDDSRINDDPFDDFYRLTHKDDPIGDKIPPCGVADLENLEFDTPLGSQQLSDLSFGSQDSSWLDHF